MDGIIADNVADDEHLVARGLPRLRQRRRQRRRRTRGTEGHRLRRLARRGAGHLPPDLRLASRRRSTTRRRIAGSSPITRSKRCSDSDSSVPAAWVARTCARFATCADVRIVAVAEPLDTLRDEAVAEPSRSTGYVVARRPCSPPADIDGVLIVTPSDTSRRRHHTQSPRRACRSSVRNRAASRPRTRDEHRTIVRDAGVALQIGYWRRFVPGLRVAARRHREWSLR